MEFRAKKTSVKAKDNLPPPKIFRATDFLWNAPALLRVYGRVNYTFDCKLVSKSLFNWGILHIPYSFRKSFEKRAQFASPNALQNNLHIERSLARSFPRRKNWTRLVFRNKWRRVLINVLFRKAYCLFFCVPSFKKFRRVVIWPKQTQMLCCGLISRARQHEKSLAEIFKILTLRLYFWIILNWQLVYFI